MIRIVCLYYSGMVLSLAEERNFTDCDYTDGDNCLRTFYVATDGSFTPVMIDEGRSKQPIFSLTHVHACTCLAALL